jgi:hypothetical protein
MAHAISHLILSTTSGNEVDNVYSVFVNGTVQYGIAHSILIPQLLISQKMGKLWGCHEECYGFVGPQVIHSKLDDLSRQME